jgi:ATP-dependent Zn protease
VGFFGADLKKLVNEAALMAARREKDQVDTEDFEMEEKVQEALNHNIPVLDALAAALLAHETLSREQVDEVLEEAGMAVN